MGTTYGFREGSRFPGEYVSRFLLSDRFRHIAALDEPHVVVADFHFEEAGHVLHLLDLVTQAGGDKLFIICKNMWEKAIDTLVAIQRARADYNLRGYDQAVRGPASGYDARFRAADRCQFYHGRGGHEAAGSDG